VNRVVVATDCPSCGAPLDFEEGSNAVTCGHCGSNLLVTGRKQLLSYSVSPKLSERRAVALAVMAQRNAGRSDFCGTKARLYFVPYYRMTGQDFSWEKPQSRVKPDEGCSGEIEPSAFGWSTLGKTGTSTFGGWSSIFDAGEELMESLFERALGIHSETARDFGFTTGENGAGSHRSSAEKVFAGKNHGKAYRGSLYENGDVLLNDRYIEKNFLACDLHGVGLYSLGVRPAVLRLELFNPAVLKALGKIVHPAMGPDDAESVGLKTAPDRQILYRKVIGKILSLVYFPFWFVEMESSGTSLVTVIDAVSESVVKVDAPVSVYETLDREFRDTPRIVGFRPLTCPNCGWDFPVRKDNTIFFCRTCSRAWQICGSELSGIPYQVADAVQPDETCSVQHLPFWVLHQEQKGSRDFRFFMPAFRYRRLKFLLDVGLKISRLQPSYKVRRLKDLELSGCYYDADDALLLAQFVKAVLDAPGAGELHKNAAAALPLSGALLTWVPFLINGAYLSSPFGKISIPRNLLLQ
jgi:predicted RNA-binding Zn-ribbon protein involved in translation (DUF1610 family)